MIIQLLTWVAILTTILSKENAAKLDSQNNIFGNIDTNKRFHLMPSKEFTEPINRIKPVNAQSQEHLLTNKVENGIGVSDDTSNVEIQLAPETEDDIQGYRDTV